MFAVTGGLFESPAPLDLILFCFCFQFVVVVAGAGSESAWSATTGQGGLELLDNGAKANIQKKYDDANKLSGFGFYPPRVDASAEWPITTYTLNCFFYLLVFSWLSLVSVALNLLVSLLLSVVKVAEILVDSKFENFKRNLDPDRCDVLKLRLLTYRQMRTIWSTTAGLIFSSTFFVYILIYCLLIYKFYLTITAEDPKGANEYNVDECGQNIPRGINKPNDAVWIAILSIAITFTSFPVCHVNKISLSRASDLYSTLKYETIYGFLSFTSKLILLFNIFAGIVMRGDSGIEPSDYRSPVNISKFEQAGASSEHDDDDNLSASIISIMVVIPTCLILGIISYYNILLALPGAGKRVIEAGDKGSAAEGVVNTFIKTVVSKLVF